MSLIGHVCLLPEPRIDALLSHPGSVPGAIDASYNAPDAGFVDLDKSWHCLHFLLTGRAEGGEPPLDFLLHGGTAVGSDDLGGAGPARVFRHVEVARIADALAPLQPSTLLARFDLKRLEKLEVYPGRWSSLNLRSDYETGYYLGPFGELKRVSMRAKLEGLGMLVWIS